MPDNHNNYLWSKHKLLMFIVIKNNCRKFPILWVLQQWKSLQTTQTRTNLEVCIPNWSYWESNPVVPSSTNWWATVVFNIIVIFKNMFFCLRIVRSHYKNNKNIFSLCTNCHHNQLLFNFSKNSIIIMSRTYTIGVTNWLPVPHSIPKCGTCLISPEKWHRRTSYWLCIRNRQ